MPKVSVVIPCFNHGKYIDGAVESILKQTYQDFEIIIVDDGSDDLFTRERLSRYKHPKIEVMRIKNTGVSGARNIGIKRAKGKYILTLDADDNFHSKFLERAVKILHRNPKVGVVTSIVQELGLRKRIWYPKGGDIRNFLTFNNCLSNALFRKKCWEEVGGYDNRMTEGYEDWNFWIAITQRGWVVYTIEEALSFYRIHDYSRNRKSIERHPELVKKIVLINTTVFQEYIDLALFEREKRIQKILNSKSYKLGSLVVGAIKFLFNTLKINVIANE